MSTLVIQIVIVMTFWLKLEKKLKVTKIMYERKRSREHMTRVCYACSYASEKKDQLSKKKGRLVAYDFVFNGWW